MKDVVRSSCPTCQRPLSIPAEWTGKSVRCKHCGQTMEIRRKAASVAAATVPAGPPPVPRARAAEPPPVPSKPLPANRELPEYTPPVAAAALPLTPVVSPFAEGEVRRPRPVQGPEEPRVGEVRGSGALLRGTCRRGGGRREVPAGCHRRDHRQAPSEQLDDDDHKWRR